MDPCHQLQRCQAHPFPSRSLGTSQPISPLQGSPSKLPWRDLLSWGSRQLFRVDAQQPQVGVLGRLAKPVWGLTLAMAVLHQRLERGFQRPLYANGASDLQLQELSSIWEERVLTRC